MTFFFLLCSQENKKTCVARANEGRGGGGRWSHRKDFGLSQNRWEPWLGSKQRMTKSDVLNCVM
jgi:hypothetical protein